MMETPIFHPLFSGSNGNCTYIEYRNTAVLIDAGVSGKKITDALAAHGKSMDRVDAILVTHEHQDHIHAVGVLSRKYDLPVFATAGTWRMMYNSIGTVYKDYIQVIDPTRDFSVGDLDIVPFRIPHDAADPVAYSLYADEEKVTVATDIGEMSEKLFLAISGSASVLIESNYDRGMLQNGRYTPSLKQRIAGKFGHLSNEEAAAVCARLACLGTREIILGHLSAENNTPDLAYRTTKILLERSGVSVGQDVALSVARRSA